MIKHNLKNMLDIYISWSKEAKTLSDVSRYENEFTKKSFSLLHEEGLDQEQFDELAIWIARSVYDIQNAYHEANKKVGRPSLGETKKVSITLPAEEWERIEMICKQEKIKKSAFFRGAYATAMKATQPFYDDSWTRDR